MGYSSSRSLITADPFLLCTTTEIIMMLPLEPLFCPCCTPAILHTLSQSDLTQIPRQMLWLGAGALSAAVKTHRQPTAIAPTTTAIAPEHS